MMHEITCQPPLDGAVFTYPEVACELFKQRVSWLWDRLDMVQPDLLWRCCLGPQLPLGSGNCLTDTAGCCQHRVSLRTTDGSQTTAELCRVPQIFTKKESWRYFTSCSRFTLIWWTQGLLLGPQRLCLLTPLIPIWIWKQ